jgi:hypothetical protein
MRPVRDSGSYASAEKCQHGSQQPVCGKCQREQTPDEKRREAIAAACQRDSELDILWHTIPQGPVVIGVDWASGQDMTVYPCTRCGTPTTRAGLCHACSNPISCSVCGCALDSGGICTHCGSPICMRYERER